MTDLQELAVIKQCAQRLTSFGFPNEPRAAGFHSVRELSPSVLVVMIGGMMGTGAMVHALVVIKPHRPVPAAHVVDFRVGSDIYSAPSDA